MASRRDLLTLIPDLKTLNKNKYSEVIKVLKFIIQVDDEESRIHIPSIEEVTN